MKIATVAVGFVVSVVVSVAFGQNGNMNMNSWGLNNMNNWNGLNSNMNNWNGLNSNMNNWNGMNNNMNWNGLNSNMNNWNSNGMNWNMLNTNMRNINGGRGGIYGDATAASAKHLLMTAAPLPVTVVPHGDGGSASAVLTSSNENVIIIASSADDPTEGHAIITGGDGIGMHHKADV